MAALALRVAAAWEEYQRKHVPDNTQRQEFTAPPPVKEGTARSHEMMPKLVTELDRLAEEMLLASDEDVLVPVPEVDVMAKRPQGLLNVGTLSARMAVLRSCALDI
jgi:hypothetical protein